MQTDSCRLPITHGNIICSDQETHRMTEDVQHRTGLSRRTLVSAVHVTSTTISMPVGAGLL